MLGRNLSNYEILEEVGRGGMGIVYRARDKTLGREVAVKVLPDELSADAGRLERFHQEARLLASLSHSGIARLYGLEQSEGRRFLVMEFVEGETLHDRLGRGPIPADEALRLFEQIANALAAAHERGIVHRDLKPGNIKITPDADIKLLDFGLAKAFALDAASGDASRFPTLVKEGTESGEILGTAPYMSPEQARGKSVDKRTDIWAFGCCLFEALAGRKVFEGESTADVLAAVLRAKPDWSALPPSTSSSVRRLLRQCLDPDPNRRLHDIADADLYLRDELSEPQGSRVSDSERRHKFPWGTTIPWLFATLLLFLGLWGWLRTPDRSPDVTRRLTVTLPPEETLALVRLTGARPVLALSPDGRTLVYVASRDGKSRLYERSLDGFEARLIPATEGAYGPFFSPDGDWVAFFVERELKKVSLRGGEPVTICEARDAHGGTWTSRNDIYFVQGSGRALFRVRAAGGDAERFLGGERLFWPSALPSGRHLLLSSQNRIVAVDTETADIKVLLEQGSYPRYLPTGHLVYARSQGMMVVGFDPERLETKGSAVPIPERVRMETFGAAHLAIASEGSVAYLPGNANQGHLVWVDRAGKAEPLNLPPATYGTFQIAPDGERLAIEVQGASTDIWVFDLAGGGRNRLTFEGGINRYPIWSPSGQWVVFNSDRSGAVNLYRKSSDGSGPDVQITKSEYQQLPYSWSMDGNRIAFTQSSPDRLGDIWILRLDEDADAQPFTGGVFHESFAVFSPGGEWLAYTSDESGRSEVYVTPFPGPGAARQISTEGGEEPVWSARGDALFYRNGPQMLMVSVQLGSSFAAGAPKLLFEGNYLKVSGRSFDVTADGERFLFIERDEESAPREIRVILNWFDEVKRLVPSH
jgi:serine/threonine protein kinase